MSDTQQWEYLIEYDDNTEIQVGLKEMFLEDFGFKGTDNAAKVAFIQNRWSKFTQYVQANYKFYLEIKYS